MYFGCSKEPSHRDGSVEYPQHMFWLRNKKNNFQLRTLIWGPENTKILTIYALIDSFFWFDTSKLGWYIIHIKGSKVIIYH